MRLFVTYCLSSLYWLYVFACLPVSAFFNEGNLNMSGIYIVRI